MKLCLQDLADLTSGEIRLAAMPPLAGELTPIGRILLKAASIEPGDVFWRLSTMPGDIELAFLRGALGVVSSLPAPNPWPGRFVLIVNDPVAALHSLVEALSQRLILQRGELFVSQASELKVLQLCANQRSDISPPTCGQAAKGRKAKCRRQAA